MKNFRLNSAYFDFGGDAEDEIKFVATPTDSQKHQTHFTLLMGANGSYKSRALAGCVDLLCYQQSIQSETKPERPSECCLRATIESGGTTGEIAVEKFVGVVSDLLPSRVLALSNLVRDRFTFGKRDEEDNADRFYYYLGVRQATNLTTTGAMDRIVADAFLEVLPERESRSLLFRWIGKLFPKYELAFGFANLRLKTFDRFLEDPVEYVTKMRGMTRPSPSARELERIPEETRQIERLQPFFQRWRNPKEPVVSSFGSKRPQLVSAPLHVLSDSECAEFADLQGAFDVARRLRMLAGPFMLLRRVGKRETPWLELTNLSSGEQNLISTGARLIAHAKPGSFIVIDEPELSLNVAWQQRYIELINSALASAKGSHVVIASHSPHLVASLEPGKSTVIVAELEGDSVRYSSHDGSFFGWGSESILYKVLDIPSASNYEFTRELSAILLHIQEGGKDRKLLDEFSQKCRRLELWRGDDALAIVVAEIDSYREGLGS